MRDIYFHGVRQSEFKPLTIAEELEVLEKAAAGDKSAVEKLVKSNQGYIMNCAKKFCRAVPLDDLIQIGNEAFILCLDTFDLEKFKKMHCSRFITYSARRIIQAMRKAAIAESLGFSASEGTAVKILKIKHEVEKLDGVKNSSFALLEEKTGVRAKLIKKYLPAAVSVARISTEESEPNSPRKIIEANISAHEKPLDESVLDKIDAEKVLKGFEILTEGEKEVLIKNYGLDLSEPKTFIELSRLWGVSREAVRQKHHRAIKKLKKVLEAGRYVF